GRIYNGTGLDAKVIVAANGIALDIGEGDAVEVNGARLHPRATVVVEDVVGDQRWVAAGQGKARPAGKAALDYLASFVRFGASVVDVGGPDLDVDDFRALHVHHRAGLSVHSPERFEVVGRSFDTGRRPGAEDHVGAALGAAPAV